MKHIKKIIATLLCLSMLMNIAISTVVAEETTPSEGLEFALNEDGVSYSVTGLGTCADTEVVIPAVYNGKPVTSIGDGAFWECTSITSVVIPNSIKLIDAAAFYRCTSLMSVEIPDSVTHIERLAFLQCFSLTNVNIGNGVKYIGDRAFEECTALTSIVIPDSVTSMGECAFSYCESLTSITLSDNVTSIASEAFYNCSNLTSITIPNSVTNIGEWAFRNCSSLTKITIPDSVTIIDTDAFDSCTNLTSIYIMKPTCHIEASKYTLGSPYNTTIYGYTDSTSQTYAETYGYKFETILTDAPEANEGLEFTLNEDGASYSVTGVGDLPDGTEVVIPAVYNGKPVTSIGSDAFAWFIELKSITIPVSVTTIEPGAFSNTSLKDVYYSGTSEEWEKVSKSYNAELLDATIHFNGDSSTTHTSQGLSFTLNKDGVSYSVASIGTCTDTEIVIPAVYNGKPVTSIGEYAFASCEKITSITIPDSITNISWWAFDWCTGLTSIIVDENNPVYHSDGNCLIDTNAKILVKGCNTSVIPTDGSITSIGIDAFSGTSLTSVTIPDGVTSIGNFAFDGCFNLETIILPNSLASVGQCVFSTGNCLIVAYYKGTESEWNQIDNPWNSGILTNATVYYYSETAPMVEGDFWHYVDDVPTVWESVVSDSIGLEFTLNSDNKSYSVTGLGTCKDTEVVIPAVYNGKPVTSIAEHAFEGCTSLTSITIPDSVTSIEHLAFYSCTSLQSVSIPDSVTSIGDSAFSDCPSLTSITLPSNLTKISGFAFATSNGLTSVIIPNSVTSIVYGAFNQCYNIKDVYYIGTEAEWNAIDIVSNKNEYLLNANRYYYSETLPTVEGDFWHYIDDVPTVWGPVVSGSIGLEFTLNADNQSYSVSQGTCTDDHIVIPATYEGLPVTIISASAFVGSNLISITIPNSIATIEEMAFMWTPNFTDVYYIGTPEEWDALNKNDDANVELFEQVTIHFNGDSSTTHTSEGLEFTLNEDGVSYSVVGIGTCTDTDVVIPAVYNGKPVTRIGSMAFMNGSSFTSMTIPDSVTSIGDGAFRYCTSLISITIPDSVTSIGDQAFSECTGLTSVSLGNGITSIGDFVFYSCENLTNITIPDGVTSIGKSAFLGCAALESITIPDNVTSIGDGAFHICTGLTSVTIGNSVTSIGSSAFYNCTGLTSITIPDSVTSIGDKAFDNCTGLTSITIPDGVTSIGERAFASCSGLTNITIGNGVKSIGGYAFYDCENITSITIPDSVTSIGEWAFCCCTGLTSVTIPDSVTSIGSSAFATCTALTSVTIPDSLTSIDEQVFYNCTGLTSIIIPNSITSIGEWAFINCINLNDVYFTGTEAEWNAIPVGSGNEPLANATIYYYSETQPTVEGDFWHYVDGVPTAWAGHIHEEPTGVSVNFVNYTGSGANQATVKIGETDVEYNNKIAAEAVLGTDGEFTVTCAIACVVLVKNGDSYDRVTATLVEGNTYKFIVTPESGMEIVVAIKGDVNGNGRLDALDARQVVVAITDGADALKMKILDVNNNNRADALDARQIVKAISEGPFDW